jgi:hypothetical protein
MGLSSARGGGNWVGLPPHALAQISLELGRARTPQQMMNEIMSGSDRKDVALDKLLDLVENRSATNEVLKRHNASRETIRQAYQILSTAGAAQWVGPHFASASALYYPESLEAVLSAAQRGESNLETAYQIVEYFRSGSPLTRT